MKSFFCLSFILYLCFIIINCKNENWDNEEKKWFDYRFDPVYDIPRLNLQNGQDIPQLGYGTYLSSGNELTESIKFALRLGYRHIDTAIYYQNHKDIGKAIGELGVSHDTLFITSKIPNYMFGFDETLNSINLMRNELNIRSIDLCLIHHPITHLGSNTSNHILTNSQIYEQSNLRKQTWLALEEAKNDGICKSIGVSNYEIKHLNELLQYSKYIPAVNQIEYHPYFIRKDLIKYCKQKHIVIEAYGSIVPKGDTSLLKEPIIKELSKKYSKTGGQILLRWAVQQGIVVIPKSLNKQHIAENSKIFDFEIETKDIKQINKLNKNHRYFTDQSNVPVYDWTKHGQNTDKSQPPHDEL